LGTIFNGSTTTAPAGDGRITNITDSDWYDVTFQPPTRAGSADAAAGIKIDFALNDNDDYRFEVYTSCGAPLSPWEGFGSPAPEFTLTGATPYANEWTFDDIGTALGNPGITTDNVAWPTQVFVRVFRHQNNGVCSAYRLRVADCQSGDIACQPSP